jgi:DNA repair protein RadA/Sms
MAREMNLNVALDEFKHGTNILEVQVPEKLRRRISSGIDWLDFSLGNVGGFTPSTVTMLTGGSGFGKTTLILQLADAITAAGHVALFNTGEECLYQTKMVVERLKIKHGFYCGQDVMVKDILNHARKLSAKNPGKQVFLFQDSIQACDDGFYSNGATNGNTPVRCTEMLTAWAKETLGIVVFIGQVNKGGEFAGKNAMKHAIDVHLHFRIDDDKKSETYGERLLETRKNRFGRSSVTVILGMGSDGLTEKGRSDFIEA